MFKKILVVITILIVSTVFSNASEIIEKTKTEKDKRGWWWYEIPEKLKEEEKKKEKTEEKKETKKEDRNPVMANYTYKQLWEMHPDDFQPLLMAFQKKAVQAPTIDNVRDYYKIQDIARRKAVAFTNVSSYVMQTQPELSVASDFPLTAPGRVALSRQRTANIERKIKEAVNDFAVLYFYSPECAFCDAQSDILVYFKEKYKIKIKKINIDVEVGLATSFNVTSVPYLILIGKGKSDHIPISAGVISVDEMEQKIYRGIRFLNREIIPEEYGLYEYQEGGAFDILKPFKKEEITYTQEEK